MNVTIQTRNNLHGINGIPVPIRQIIDQQAVVVLPSGKKAFVEVASITSFLGEVAFDSPDQASLVPDEAVAVVPVEPQPAPLFEGVKEIGDGIPVKSK